MVVPVMTYVVFHRDDDVFADVHFVEIAEWRLVRGAVTGECRVAELTGEGSIGEIADTRLEVLMSHPGNKVEVDSDVRNLDAAQDVTPHHFRQVLILGRDYRLVGGGRGRWLDAGVVTRVADGLVGERQRLKCSTVTRRIYDDAIVGDDVGRSLDVGDRLRCHQFLELVVEFVLCACCLDSRAPQLVGHEQEHHQTGGDEYPAEMADEEAPVVRLGRAVPLAHPLLSAGSTRRVGWSDLRRRGGGWRVDRSIDRSIANRRPVIHRAQANADSGHRPGSERRIADQPPLSWDSAWMAAAIERAGEAARELPLMM